MIINNCGRKSYPKVAMGLMQYYAKFGGRLLSCSLTIWCNLFKRAVRISFDGLNRNCWKQTKKGRLISPLPNQIEAKKKSIKQDNDLGGQNLFMFWTNWWP